MGLIALLEQLQQLDLGRPGQRQRPARDDVRALQQQVTRALSDGEFVTDCIERDRSAWNAWAASDFWGLKPPIAELPERGIVVRLFFWPPGAVAPPHEHTAWVVSAVFQNQLEVRTYDWEQTRAQRALVPKNVFSAEQGKAGHIYEPCIHSPRNPSSALSTTLHFFRTDDEPVLEREVGPIAGLTTYDRSTPLPAAEPGSAAARERRAALTALHDAVLVSHLTLLQGFPSARGLELVENLYAEGGSATRRAAERALSSLAPSEAAARLRRLRAAWGTVDDIASEQKGSA